jgi:hypothetical protein
MNPVQRISLYSYKIRFNTVLSNVPMSSKKEYGNEGIQWNGEKVRWKAKCVRHRTGVTCGSDLVKLQVIMAVSVQTVVLWAIPIIISFHGLFYDASVSRLCNFDGRITDELRIEKIIGSNWESLYYTGWFGIIVGAFVVYKRKPRQ